MTITTKRPCSTSMVTSAPATGEPIVGVAKTITKKTTTGGGAELRIPSERPGNTTSVPPSSRPGVGRDRRSSTPFASDPFPSMFWSSSCRSPVPITTATAATTTMPTTRAASATVTTPTTTSRGARPSTGGFLCTTPATTRTTTPSSSGWSRPTRRPRSCRTGRDGPPYTSPCGRKTSTRGSSPCWRERRASPTTTGSWCVFAFVFPSFVFVFVSCIRGSEDLYRMTCPSI